jgi:catechol 2,3-dioxygenase-like lactoylglutathione lyase family enzyme
VGRTWAIFAMSFPAPSGPIRKPDNQEDEVSETSSSTHITQVGTVMVPVSDRDRAIEFYVGKLGFEMRADIPFGDGERWVEVAPQGAATSIALVLPREGESAGIETRIGFTTEDAEADHADLAARGVDVDEEVMRMGGPVPPMFFFRDQDGNRLLIVQRD